jgi:hypothetical protein
LRELSVNSPFQHPFSNSLAVVLCDWEKSACGKAKRRPFPVRLLNSFGRAALRRRPDFLAARQRRPTEFRWYSGFPANHGNESRPGESAKSTG